MISRLKTQSTQTFTSTLVDVSEDDGIEENLDDICDSVLHSDSDCEDFEGFDGFDK